MEQLVALLLALAALDALAVHLLGHLLVADLLLLGRPALLDLLDAGLGESAGKTQRRKGERKEKMSYLALGLLLLLHLALALLDGGHVLALLETLRIRGQAGAGPERLLGGMPILACRGVVSRSAAVAGGGEKKVVRTVLPHAHDGGGGGGGRSRRRGRHGRQRERKVFRRRLLSQPRGGSGPFVSRFLVSFPFLAAPARGGRLS